MMDGKEKIEFIPIGMIQSDYKILGDIPRQSILSEGQKAKIILKDEYREGLLRLEESEHILILFYFHKAEGCQLQFISRHSKKLKGAEYLLVVVLVGQTQLA